MAEAKGCASTALEENDNNKEEETVKCFHCRRTVKDKVQCVKCKQYFHQSCLITSNQRQNTCKHETIEKNDMVPKLLSEIALLKRIIQEQEEKYSLLVINNRLLEENAKLLKENNNYLNEKLQKNKNTYSSMLQKEMEPAVSRTREFKTSETNKKTESNKNDIVRVVKENLIENQASQQEEITPSNTQLQETPAKKTAENEQEKWHVQQRKKKRQINRPLFYGTSEENTVEALPRKTWFFVSRLKLGMTDTELKTVLSKQCPNEEIIVEKQKLFYEYQSAFKVGLPFEILDKANETSFWPRDCRVSKYNFLLERKKLRQPLVTNEER